MFRSRQLFPLVLAALCGSVVGQEPQPCPRTVPVTVIDRDGNLIPALTAVDFQARMDGKPVKVLSAANSEGRGRVLILLDSSGSMLEPESKWALARTLVRQFVEKAPPEMPLAFAHHATKIRESIGFGQTRQSILRKLEELQSINELKRRKPIQTALADTLVEAADLFGQKQTGDTILAITDAGSADDRKSDGYARDVLIQSGVRFFAVFLPAMLSEAGPRVGGRRISSPTGMRIAPPDADGIARFRELALQSGGNTFTLLPNIFDRYNLKQINAFVPGADSRFPPEVSLERLWRQALTFYQLELSLPGAIYKQETWKLEVLDQQGKKRKDVEGFYPRRLMPCATGATDR